MIRVIIERKIADYMEKEFHDAIREAVGKAAHFPGYISGETHREVENPHHFLVMVSWANLSDWERWNHSDERKELTDRVAPLLEEPETVTILEQM